MDWKDTTSFSQGELDRTPRTYKAKVGRMTLVVTRHIHFDKEDWVMNCAPFINQETISGNVNAEVAKQVVEQTLVNRLTEHISLLRI